MPRTQPAPSTRRRSRSAVLLVSVLTVLTGASGCGAITSSSREASGTLPPSAHRALERAHGSAPGEPPGGRQGDVGGALGEGAGELPDGVTALDAGYPAVANLDPALLVALRRASIDARRDGVEVYINSGWRSSAYQEWLLAEAVATYGTRAEAARWVATPSTSPHVSGDAVDVGDSEAAAWLSEHGAQYALCQTYDNEPWHLELRPEAIDQGCPARYADPTQDPRMQQ